jgi:hypothetical protein
MTSYAVKRRRKKIHLPPTNLKGVKTYLRRKGHRINPALESGKAGAKFTYDKPLPDGRRIHGAVYEHRDKICLKQHIDKSDPYKNPIGHLINDVAERRRNTVYCVKKKKKRKKNSRAYF